MAGNMKAVKLRIKSVQSTMQITKAISRILPPFKKKCTDITR